MNKHTTRFLSAFNSRDVEEFLFLCFPPAWSNAANRIIASGAQFGPIDAPWYAGWSTIPPTIRVGSTPEETAMKSIIYRVHDCIHNLWPNPLPSMFDSFDEEHRSSLKRAIISAEIAVLTITEFFYCKWIYNTYPELRECILKRRAISVYPSDSMIETAVFLDAILRGGEWLWLWTTQPEAEEFQKDYVRMLDEDRKSADKCWEAICTHKDEWIKLSLRCSAGRGLRGFVPPHLGPLETTLFMVVDFQQSAERKDTHPVLYTDYARKCNQENRQNFILPSWWPR